MGWREVERAGDEEGERDDRPADEGRADTAGDGEGDGVFRGAKLQSLR